MPSSSANWEFGRGVIVHQGRVHVLSFPVVDSGEEPGGVTQVINWRPNQLSSFMIPWEAKAICYVPMPEPYLAIIGSQGDVFISSPHGNVEEVIDQTDNGPNARGVIRDVRFIGEHLYAVGMGRQVYRREWRASAVYGGHWSHIDQDVLPDKPSPDIIGFCCVDGFSEEEIYVAGWQGEIWWYNGTEWNAADSPTNIKLERIVCAQNGYVYAMGQSAVVLKGRKDMWQQIEHDATNKQFWGSTWYRDRLWLSTDSGLYRMTEKDELEEADIGIGGKLTFRWLDSADGMVWSFGPNHLLHSSNGEDWTLVVLD